MSPSAPHLAELPTETLEHVLLYLPGQDIVKMEAVQRLPLIPPESSLIFVLYDLGQPTLPGPYSQLAYPSAPTQALCRRSNP